MESDAGNTKGNENNEKKEKVKKFWKYFFLIKLSIWLVIALLFIVFLKRLLGKL